MDQGWINCVQAFFPREGEEVKGQQAMGKMTREAAKNIQSYGEPKVDAMLAQKEDELDRHRKEKEMAKRMQAARKKRDGKKLGGKKILKKNLLKKKKPEEVQEAPAPWGKQDEKPLSDPNYGRPQQDEFDYDQRQPMDHMGDQ